MGLPRHQLNSARLVSSKLCILLLLFLLVYESSIPEWGDEAGYKVVSQLIAYYLKSLVPTGI